MQPIIRRRNSWLIVLLAGLGAIASPAGAAADDDPLDTPRMLKMLADGDTGMVVQVFRRYPGRTLPFIDSFLEGGLAMIEKGQDDPAKAAEGALVQFRTAIGFAKLADEAFGGSTFADYANAFASWSPSEQKTFREGQRAFKEGMKETDAKKARASLLRSLKLARSLGDTWGQAMALSGLAERAMKSGDPPRAREHAVQAAMLNRKLQLQEDCVEALHIAAEAAAHGGGPDEGLRHLAQAWTVVKDSSNIDPAVREKTLNAYLAALEAADMKDEADEVRSAESEG